MIAEIKFKNTLSFRDETVFSFEADKSKEIEYIIERFLKESDKAQLLLTNHYDDLLAKEYLLRKDNVWFTEKSSDGATILYPLTNFKRLNRISSLQKSYQFGEFIAIPNI